MLGTSVAAILAGRAAGSILFGGSSSSPPPAGPTGINTNPSTISLTSLAAGTTLAQVQMVGGTLPMSSGSPPTLTGADAGKLQVANINNAAGTWDIQVKSGATATPSTNWAFGMTVTDSNNLSFASAVDAYAVVVGASPVVTLSAGSVPDNAPPGTPVSGMTGHVTGTGAISLVDLDGNTNFDIAPLVGSSFSINVSNTGPGGIGTQQVDIQATDALGFTGVSGQTDIVVQDHTASVYLTSFKAVKKSAGTQAANTICDWHRLNFPDGAVAAGTYPIIKQGSTVCKYSFGHITNWDSGCVQGISVRVMNPVATVFNTPTQFDVYSNGTAPAASSRTSADFPDVQVEMDILYGAGAGNTYVANLADGFANGRVKVFADGPAGKTWRVETQAKLAGVAHGQLVVFFFCTALQADDGSLYGVEVKPRVCQPYVEATSPAKGLIVFSQVRFNDGSTTHDRWAEAWTAAGITFPVAFQWDHNNAAKSNAAIYAVTDGTPINYGTGLCTGVDKGAYCAFVTATGSGLPSKLTANTPYWVFSNGTGTNFSLFKDSQAIASGVLGNQTVNSDTSGTGNFTQYQFCCWGSGFFVCPTTGLYNFVQTGSVAAATDCFIQNCTSGGVTDNTYLRSTKLIPPYNFSAGANTQTAQPYLPNGCTLLIDQSMTSTGERAELGPLSNMVGLYIGAQDSGGEQVVRALAMTESHFSTCLRSSSNGNIINGATSANFTGIAQPPIVTGGNKFYWLSSGGTANGVPSPPGANLQGTFAEIIGAHMPNHSYAAALLFGAPEFIDLVMEKANRAIYSSGIDVQVPTELRLTSTSGPISARNYLIGSTSYEGCSVGTTGNPRTDAWNTRDVAYGKIMSPRTANYDGSDTHSYFGTSLNNTYTVLNGWLNLWTTYTFAKANGLVTWQAPTTVSGFMSHYLGMIHLVAAKAAEDSEANTFASLVVAGLPAMIWKNAYDAGAANRVFELSAYQFYATQSTSGKTPTPYAPVTSEGQMGGVAIISWTTTTPHFSVPNTAINNGDTFLFDGDAATPSGTNIPFTTPLWVYNLATITGGMSFELSSVAPSDGSFPQQVLPANSGTINRVEGVFQMAYGRPTGATAQGNFGADGYATQAQAMLNWFVACGYTVPQAVSSSINVQAELDAQVNAHISSATRKANPKYYMQPAF